MPTFMPTFKAVIVKNETGEARTYATEFSDDRGVVYMFQDGNYSCDCNRHLFWHRANGDEPEDDAPCGDVIPR